MDLNSFAVPFPPFYDLQHQDLPLDALAERFRNLPFLGNEKNAKVNTSPKPHYVKRPWSQAEDRLLARSVKQHGDRNWSHIAQIMHGRIGKQCRDRWHNNLRPGLKKKAWSEEENRILIQVHSELGNNWSQIARRFPGRSQNSIKNHWHTGKRSQLSFQRSRRSSQPKTANPLQRYTMSPNDSNVLMTVAAPMTASATMNDNNFMEDVARETDRNIRNEGVRMELDLFPVASGCNNGHTF